MNTKKQAIIRALKEGAQKQLKINEEHNPSAWIEENLTIAVYRVVRKSGLKESFDDYQFKLESLIEEASKPTPDLEFIEDYSNEVDQAKEKVKDSFESIYYLLKEEGKNYRELGWNFDLACVEMPIVYDLFDEEHADEPNPSR